MEEKCRGSSDRSKDRSNSNSSSETVRRGRNKRSKSRSRSRRRNSSRGSSDSLKKGGYYKRQKLEVYVPGLDCPMVSYREFMHLQRENNISTEQTEKIYNKYKRDYEKKQIDIFFYEHKDDQWFIEKYHPELKYQLHKHSLEEAKNSTKRFENNLTSGIYDKLSQEASEELLNMKKDNLAEKEKQLLNMPKLDLGQESTANDGEHSNNNMTTTSNNQHGQDNGGPPSDKFDKNNLKGDKGEIILDEDYPIMNSPYFGFDPNGMTLFIRNVPKHCTRQELIDIVKDCKGYLSLSLSDPPLRTLDFMRYGWVLFETEQNCMDALNTLGNPTVGGVSLNIVKSKSQRKFLKIVSPFDAVKLNKHQQLSGELIRTLDKEKELTSNKLQDTTDDREPIKQFDLQILYLRKIHSYCYFTPAEYHDERMLAAKCGVIYLRDKLADSDELGDGNPDWDKLVTSLVRMKIEDCQKSAVPQFMTQKIDEEVTKRLKKKLEECEGGSWPCYYCEKFFLGEQFVLNHLTKKHANKVADSRKRIVQTMMFENYTNDKNRIVGPPVQNGNRNKGNRGGDNQGRNRGQKYGNRRGEKEPKDYRDLDEPTENVTKTKQYRELIDYNDI